MGFYLSIYLLLISLHNITAWNLIGPAPITNAIINMFCGATYGPKYEIEPLRYSPWMGLLTTISPKGKDIVLKCGATLISGRHAITSEECLKARKASKLSLIFGAPNLRDLLKGTKRQVNKILILVSDIRLAVLQFDYLYFGYYITPICLSKVEGSGVFATVGWADVDPKDKDYDPTYDRKVAYFKMDDDCTEEDYCAEQLPADDPWELDTSELHTGAPLIIGDGTYWYLEGIMVENDQNGEGAQNGGTAQNGEMGPIEKLTQNQNEAGGEEWASKGVLSPNGEEGQNGGLPPNSGMAQNGGLIPNEGGTQYGGLDQNGEGAQYGGLDPYGAQKGGVENENWDPYGKKARRRRVEIRIGRGHKKREVHQKGAQRYFAKITPDIVEELKNLFSILS